MKSQQAPCAWCEILSSGLSAGFGVKARLMRFGALASLAMAMAAPVSAADPIPETPGWGGFVIAGVGFASLRSNTIAGNRLFDIGKPRFDSLGARPSTDGSFLPVITGELNYSFSGGWQAFFGTALEDAVTLDGVTQLGLRKDLAGSGIFQTGLLFSGIPTKVWEDSYAEGVERKTTDRESTGLRLQWNRVMGSGLDVTFSYRDISIDTERNGEGLLSVPCDVACRDLLRRDGDQYSFDVSYLFGRLGEGRNQQLRPRVRYTVDDREGDAMAGDSIWLQFTHGYFTPGFWVISNIAYGKANRDAPSPIFGVKTDPDRYVLDTTLFVRLNAFGPGWQGVGSLSWGKSDSGVNFYDSDLVLASVGMLYRLGGR